LNDLPIPILLIDNIGDTMMADDGDYNANAYWKRKQSVKKNRVACEGSEAGTDRDAEQAASNWKGESGKLDRGESLWDDSLWKDKEQDGRS